MLRKSQFLAFTSVFTGLFVVLTTVRIPLPFLSNPFFSSQISLFTLGLYVVGSLFGPYVCALAGLISSPIASLVVGTGGPSWFLYTALAGHAISGLVMGHLRIIGRHLSSRMKRDIGLAVGEGIALATARLAQAVFFFVVDLFVFGWPFACIVFAGYFTFILFIPVGAAINSAVRRAFGRTYFDIETT